MYQRNHKKSKYLLLPISLLFGAYVLATPATTNRDTEVKEQPATDASQVELLKKDTDVAILERNRGWYRVNTPAENQGWVNMLQLRFKKAPRPNTDAKLLSFIGLRDGSDNITATTGVRGIGKSDIEDAKPDLEAVQNILLMKVNADEAATFAKAINLQSNDIKYQEKNDDKN